MEVNGCELALIIVDIDRSPTEITTRLGLVPDKTWVKGDLTGFGALRHDNAGWKIGSGLPVTADFHQHLDAIIAIIQSRIAEFTSVCNEYFAELTCGLYISQADDVGTPWVNLPKESLRVLSAIGCNIDFDIYKIGVDG